MHTRPNTQQQLINKMNMNVNKKAYGRAVGVCLC